MSHVWMPDPSSDSSPAPWAAAPLVSDGFAISAQPEISIRRWAPSDGALPPGTSAVLLRCPGRSGETWAIASGAKSFRANGLRVAAGLRVLRDRDEISLGAGARFFFSSEILPRVEPLPPLDQQIYCPRCKQLIPTGSPAVRCPTCRVWHHQSEEFPCWRYADSCACNCGQSTAASTFRWTPEGQ